MKNTYICCFLILFGMSSFLTSGRVYAVPVDVALHDTRMNDCTSVLFAPLKLSELPGMERKDVELAVGRTFTLKERKILKVLQRTIKRSQKLGLSLTQDDCFTMERKASNGILFGILGLIVAGIIFGILAISSGSKAKRLAAASPECPNSAASRRRGNTGIVLGIIDIVGALIAIALLL